jgi:histidinol phosphatase-like PHP family hydrolase
MKYKVIDYHIHTIYSHDCDVPIVDRVLEAVRKGFYEIGFSDHVSTTKINANNRGPNAGQDVCFNALNIYLFFPGFSLGVSFILDV